MSNLLPLVELRAAWSAAAVCVPEHAVEITRDLDRLIDHLVRCDQLTAERLVDAVEVVVEVVHARPERVDLLRDRLLRAVRDFAAADAHADDRQLDAGIFADPEGLAALLRGLGERESDETAPTPGAE